MGLDELQNNHKSTEFLFSIQTIIPDHTAAIAVVVGFVVLHPW